MRSALVSGAMIFSNSALAAFSLDRALGTSAIANVQAYVASLHTNPAWTTNIPMLERDVPTSIAVLVKSDPQSFVEFLATETAELTDLSAVPTGVIHTLTSLASEPLHAVSDITLYVESLYQNGGASVFSILATKITKGVQDAAIADPIGFLANMVAASTIPSWVSVYPSSLQDLVASAINHALNIVASDVSVPARANVPGDATAAVATTTAGFAPASASAVVKPGSSIVSAPLATRS